MVHTYIDLNMIQGLRSNSGQLYRDLVEYDTFFCCLICVDNSVNPKLLDCQHVFCEACLQLYYKECHSIQYEQQGIFIPCPTCRKLTKVPEEGLCGLEENTSPHSERLRKVSQSSNNMQRCDVCTLKVKDNSLEAGFYCSKCLMNFCDVCHANHSQQPLFKSHPVIHISNKETLSLFCDRHSKLPIKYFCLDCNLPACTVCILHDHSGHHAAELRDALATRRDNLRTLLNSLGPKLDRMEARLKKLNNITSAHSRCSRNGLQEAQPSTSDADSASSLASENGSLSRNFSGLAMKRISSSSSLLNIATSAERIRRLFDLSTNILDMSQSKKLLLIYEDIVGRIQSILDLEIQSLQENIELSLEKVSVNDVMVHSTPPSSNTSLHNLQDSKVSLSSEESSSDGVLSEGAHQSLLIKPNLLWKVEKQRSDIGELYNPCDVDFLHDECLIVAEYDMVNDKNNRVRIFDQQGQTRDVLAQGKVRPLGLAVTREGNIVLTDCKDKRLKLFTPSGQLMADVGKGQFGWPYGVAVNSKGQIIVTDAFNDSIGIFQTDGKKIKQFGSSGSNSSQFKNPYHVAVDAKDNILVSDSGNNCIKVFDSSARFMFKTAEIRKKPSLEHVEVRKSRKKKLKGPRGICIDLKGKILVADDYSRVCMFDESGHFIRNLLTDEDGVKYPEAIACGSRGQIAVTEWNPNNMFSIKMFNMYE